MSRRVDRELKRLLKKYEPQLARAFIASIRDLSGNTDMKALIAAIERNDIEGALIALSIEPAALSPFTSGMTDAYSAAGATVVGGTKWRGRGNSKAVIRWDMANPRAEKTVREMISKMTGTFTSEARAVIRNAIADGYALGWHPNKIGLGLAGRVGANGKREGALIGLNAPQAKYVGNMRDYITSGDWASYARMTKRDRRYDAMVRRHMTGQSKMTQGQLDKVLQRYSDRLLKLRADTIARTETAQAVESGRFDAFGEWKDKTGAPDDAIERTWHSAGGRNERPWHRDLDGTIVKGLVQPFQTSKGALLMHPCDTSLGAGAVEVVSCRCTQSIRLNYRML